MIRLAICCGLLVVICGCQPFLAKLQEPPGSIQQQRFEAVLHDPYPTPHGIPAYEGSRPPGYQQPLPQPVQDRYLKDTYWFGDQSDESDEAGRLDEAIRDSN